MFFAQLYARVIRFHSSSSWPAVLLPQSCSSAFPPLLLSLFCFMRAPVVNCSGRLPWWKRVHFGFESKSSLLASAWAPRAWGQVSPSAGRDGEAALKLCQLKSAWNYCSTAPCEWGYSGWSYTRQLSTSNSSAAEWGKFCSAVLSHPAGSSAFAVCQLWFLLHPFSELFQLANPAENYVGVYFVFWVLLHCFLAKIVNWISSPRDWTSIQSPHKINRGEHMSGSVENVVGTGEGEQGLCLSVASSACACLKENELPSPACEQSVGWCP